MSADNTCPLNSIASRVFVIHLEEAAERVDAIARECHRIGLKYEVFFATNGAKEKVAFTPHPVHSPLYWNAGCAGLVHTMIRLLTQCFADDTVDSILLVEDDACFSPDFNEAVKRNLCHIPADWEMIFFGLTWLKSWEPVAGNIVRIPAGGGYSAHCVAIRRSIFPLLIEQFSKFEEPNDVTYTDRIFSEGGVTPFIPT